MRELKELLLARDYSEKLVNSAIQRASCIPREVALRKTKINEKTKRPIFAVRYDPRLPGIQNIQAKHWRSMTGSDMYLKEVFPVPPLTAFKRQANLRQYLIRAAIPPPVRQRPAREIKGMAKCGRNCAACPYIKEGRNIKVNKSQTWKINKKTTCMSHNIIYMIECQKNSCNQRYIGETKRWLRNRLADHRGYVRDQTDNATGAHFSSPGHSLADLKITVLEQVKKKDDLYRKEREKYFIQKFNTYHNGLNRQV